jgi:hypothetical protein
MFAVSFVIISERTRKLWWKQSLSNFVIAETLAERISGDIQANSWMLNDWGVEANLLTIVSIFF